MAKEYLLKHQIALLKSTTPYTLMMAGRGVGKTKGGSSLVIKSLSEHKSMIVSGPTYKQLKIVLFKAIEGDLKKHGIKYHLDKQQMIFTVFLGAEILYIYGVSADSYETARGYTNCTVLILDEAALHTQECLNVLTACLRGQSHPVTGELFEPQVYMLTTPRGSSNWTARYIDNPQCTVISCGTKDNFFLSPAYVALLESQYSGDFYRQEILGEIVDSITLALVSQADINAMKARDPVLDTKYRKVAGLDIGLSLGGDPSVLVTRQGSMFLERHAWHISDTSELAQAVVRELVHQGVHTLYVDATAIGKGPADIIRKMFPNTVLVNFGGSPIDKLYTNKRAEIWMNMAKAIKEGFVTIPNESCWDNVCEELLNTEYMMMRNTNKMGLEPKEKVTQKLGRSTDDGDAAALTYTMPDVIMDESAWSEVPRYTPAGGSTGWMS